MFSPVPKKRLEAATRTIASATSPGPTVASNAVNATQPAVVTASRRFFAACRSAHAPTSGAVRMIAAYDSDRVSVHAKVAQGRLPATAETK